MPSILADRLVRSKSAVVRAATAQVGADQVGDLSYDLKVGSLIGAHLEAEAL